jgi:hypothetical protein
VRAIVRPKAMERAGTKLDPVEIVTTTSDCSHEAVGWPGVLVEAMCPMAAVDLNAATSGPVGEK